jgi:hypothetical protein
MRLVRVLVATAWVAACSSFSSSPDAPADGGTDAGDASTPPPVPVPPGVTDAAAEADADAGALRCKTLSPAPFFCADFDDDNNAPVALSNGVQVTMPPTGIGALTVSVHDGLSPPNALWLASSGGRYNYENVSGPTTQHLTARFSVRFAKYDITDGSTGFFRFGVNGGCLAAMRVDRQAPAIVFENTSSCTGGYHIMYVLPGVPTPEVWTRFDIDLDLPGGKASIGMNGKNAGSLDVGTPGGSAGTPYLQLGVIDLPAAAVGPTIAFDDIVVETL